MQGTYYFMAINLLLVPPEGVVHTISHDLESFYWVLVWVILRHTTHAHPSGDDTFLAVFPAGDDIKCSTSKMLWLKFGAKKLTIPNNQPLTDLMLKLSTVVMNHYLLDTLDYDMVLQCFEDALAPDQKWPKDDKAVTRALPDLRTNSVMPANNRMGSKKKRRHGGSKRKADEPLPLREDVEGPTVFYDDDADPVAVRDDDTGPAAALNGQADVRATSGVPSKRRKTGPSNQGSRNHGAAASSSSRMRVDGSTEVGSVSGPATGTRSRTGANGNVSRGTGGGRATGSGHGGGRSGVSRARRTRGGSASGNLR